MLPLRFILKNGLLMVLAFGGFDPKSDTNNPIKTDSKIIYDICYTLHGSSLAVADNNTIKVYSPNKNFELSGEFSGGHAQQILSIDISFDSTLLVSAGKDSLIVVWDFNNNKILDKIKYPGGIVTSVKISPDLKYLAYGGTSNKVYLYDLKKREVRKEYSDHADIVTAVNFSADGELLATASADGKINLYETNSTALVTSLSEHKNWIRGVAFSNDKKKLLSFGDDGVFVMNISNIHHILVRDKIKSTAWILCLAISADNNTYAFANLNGRIRIIANFANYEQDIRIPIHKILFIPDQKEKLRVAVATRGRGVIIIDAINMKLNRNGGL